MTQAPRIPERAQLLEAAEKIRPVLEKNAAESERICRLPQASVDALEGAGVFRMIRPRELGGYEADPVTQHEVIERVAYADPSAGWCAFIGAGSQAFPAAHLPERGMRDVLDASGGEWPRFAGSPSPAGTAEAVDGGYRVSGRWGYASGIYHSPWVFLGFIVMHDGEPVMGQAEMPLILAGAVPVPEVEIEDSWDTSGLRGTGSTHFRADSLFVPAHRTFGFPQSTAQRGGALFELPVLGFFGPAFSGFPQGVARRALDEIIGVAETKQRIMVSSRLAERGVFQRDLGLADGRLRAAGLLVREALTDLWERLHAAQPTTPLDLSRLLFAFSHNAETASEATDVAFRYGGAEALFTSGQLQRCRRDMQAAAQHMLVGEHNYEYAGQALLGLAPANPIMGTSD